MCPENEMSGENKVVAVERLPLGPKFQIGVAFPPINTLGALSSSAGASQDGQAIDGHMMNGRKSFARFKMYYTIQSKDFGFSACLADARCATQRDTEHLVQHLLPLSTVLPEDRAYVAPLTRKATSYLARRLDHSCCKETRIVSIVFTFGAE